MPRVNRDLQRRLAARRERDRRRPTERRYNFTTTPEPAQVIEENGADAEALDTSVDNGVTPSAAPQRTPGSARATQTISTTSTRGGARTTPRPFSDYKEDYAYVAADLRRVALVIGGLLVALIVLYFALPLLVR
jgi:hypothetical protein